MTTCLVNVWILTMNRKKETFQHGFLLFDEKIIAVGEMSHLPNLPVQTEIIDGKGGIVLPGMVNTHTHVGMIPFRSLGDDVPDRLRKILFPLEKIMTPEIVEASSYVAMAEMLKAGITSFCDMYYFEEVIAKVAEKMQVRALLGETILNQATPDSKTPQEAIKYTNTFLQNWQGHDLITPIIAPHAPNTNTKEDLKAILTLSTDYQVPITMHVSEMSYEMTYFKENYQQTPIAFLEELGYFNQPFIMAHCIEMTPEDIVLLQGKDVRVAHCIGANTKSAKGVAPVLEMLEAGFKVGLGTDGPSSGNTLDLFTQMRMFANFHKTINHNRSLFTAKEIVQLATLGGAEVLGLEEKVGSLEVGKDADFILVDTSGLHMFPIYDPYSALVYQANASDVKDVWVKGKQLVEAGKLVLFKEENLKENLSKVMGPFIEYAKKLNVM